MESPRIDLSDYPELSANLETQKNGYASPEALLTSAEVLLGECGVETTIDNLPAVATKYACTVEHNGQTLYARIGKMTPKRGGAHLPQIVFDKTPGLPIETDNFTALGFRFFGDNIAVIVQNELDPLLNEPPYLELVKKVTDRIAVQALESREAARQAKESRRQAVKQVPRRLRAYFGDRQTIYDKPVADTVGEWRILKFGTTALALILGYGGQTVDRSIDAKLGPLPMPQPIELFVDLNNVPDHQAQGFKKPKEATVLQVGNKDISLPLLGSYDTRGVPSAYNGYGPYEESKPGLYRVDFASTANIQAQQSDTTTTSMAQEIAPPLEKCVTVHGNYYGAATRVFTQDADTAEKMRITVKDEKTMQACPIEGEEHRPAGSFFIWQNK